MEIAIRFPTNYNVMEEEEMIYTTGGTNNEALYAFSRLAGTLTGIGILLYNYIDCMRDAKKWYADNKTGDLSQDVKNGMNALKSYMSSSVWNFIRGLFAVGSAIDPFLLPITCITFLTV